MTDYLPITCAQHSQLELHIMHKDRLLLEWVDESQATQRESVTAIDIYSIKDDGEYLLVIDSSGNPRQVRLDRIQSLKIIDSC